MLIEKGKIGLYFVLGMFLGLLLNQIYLGLFAFIGLVILVIDDR